MVDAWLACVVVTGVGGERERGTRSVWQVTSRRNWEAPLRAMFVEVSNEPNYGAGRDLKVG